MSIGRSRAAGEVSCGLTNLLSSHSSRSRLEHCQVGAQDAKPVEVTPYVALGSSGASPVGAIVTFPVTSTLSVESETAYRRAEGDIHALSSSVSLLYFLPRVGRATPYVAGGIGLAQYGAPVFASRRSSDRHPDEPGHDGERWRRREDAHERKAGFANRCPMVQVLWPSGIGRVSRGSRHRLRCRQTIAFSLSRGSAPIDQAVEEDDVGIAFTDRRENGLAVG